MVARSRLLALALLAIVAGCTASPTGSPSDTTTVESAVPSPRQPSTGPALTPAAPSLANGRIAFIRGPVSGGPGVTTDVWLVDVPSGIEHQLTHDALYEKAPIWLVDGSRLAFAWYRNPDPYHDTLSTILPDGSGQRDLGPVQTIYSDPAVSPDGRTVAYGGDGSEDGTSGIVLLDLGTGSRTMLTRDGASNPLWSPDSRRLLAYLPSRRVLVIDAVSGAMLASIADSAVQGVLGWTSDGRSIIYVRCGDTRSSCGPWLALADGTGRQPYSGPLPSSVPHWLSPDRQWLAEVRDGPDMPGVLSLFVSPVGGGESTRLSATLGVGAVSWSPDGQWLAFNAAPVGAVEGTRIYIVNRTGGTPIPVSAGSSDEMPVWQPAS